MKMFDMKMYEYDSNNSGGRWWLSDEDWIKLEEAGWKVYWGGWNEAYTDRKFESRDKMKESDRWLGCLARTARKEFTSRRKAIAEFEEITGQNFDADGCYCCGEPHYISEV